MNKSGGAGLVEFWVCLEGVLSLREGCCALIILRVSFSYGKVGVFTASPWHGFSEVCLVVLTFVPALCLRDIWGLLYKPLACFVRVFVYFDLLAYPLS